MPDVSINWQSPMDEVPVMTRHYLVADGISVIPKIISGARLMTGLEDAFRIAEIPDAPTCTGEI